MQNNALQEKKKRVRNSKNNKEQVYVFYNSPTGIKFRLAENKVVEIQGASLSELYTPTGTRMSVGKFGITPIAREDYEQIEKLYGSMKIFESGRIFASNSENYGKDRAKEQENQLNGNEQIDISKTHTKPDTIA